MSERERESERKRARERGRERVGGGEAREREEEMEKERKSNASCRIRVTRHTLVTAAHLAHKCLMPSYAAGHKPRRALGRPIKGLQGVLALGLRPSYATYHTPRPALEALRRASNRP